MAAGGDGPYAGQPRRAEGARRDGARGPLGGGRPRGARHQPGQGPDPGRGRPRRRHQARPAALLRDHRSRPCCRTWPAAGSTCSASRTASGKMGFWQKDVPGHAPKWVSRWTYTGHEGKKDYVVVDKVATLAWLAQEAALELHPWTSRTISPHEPTFALIDVDPGDNTTWEEVLTLTRLYRTALRAPGRHRPAQDHRQARAPGMGAGAPRLPLRRDARLGGAAVADDRAAGAGHGQLGVGQARSEGSGSPGLHPERGEQDAGGAVLGASVQRGAGVGAHHAGRSWTTRPSAPDRWTIQTLGARVKKVGDLFAPATELAQELPPL